MMRKPLRLIAVVLLACTAAGLASAADTFTQKPQSQAPQWTRRAASDMQSLENQLIVTLDSLRYLLSGDPAQLRTAYNQYSDDLDRAHGQARRLDADIGEVRTQAAGYLATLDKDYASIRNEELRRATRQRRDQIDQRLQALQSDYDQVKAPLDAYLSRLDDLRIVLRNDLTVPGVEAVAKTDVVRTADADATRVREALAKTRSSGDALAGELSAPESASR